MGGTPNHRQQSSSTFFSPLGLLYRSAVELHWHLQFACMKVPYPLCYEGKGLQQQPQISISSLPDDS